LELGPGSGGKKSAGRGDTTRGRWKAVEGRGLGKNHFSDQIFASSWREYWRGRKRSGEGRVDKRKRDVGGGGKTTNNKRKDRFDRTRAEKELGQKGEKRVRRKKRGKPKRV